MIQLLPTENIPTRAQDKEFVYTARTNKEFSIICPTDYIQWEYLQRLDNRIMIELVGDFEFSESNIGITAKLSTILANAGISICFVGTFATDYIFINKSDVEKAKQAFINSQILNS